MTIMATARLEAREAQYAQDIRVGNHTIVADEPEARGGRDVGPRPYELLLCALGACTSINLRLYTERKVWDVGTIGVSLVFIKEEETDRIERTLRFSKHLTDEQRTKLLDIASKTPVTKTVMHGTPIASTIEASG